jgi:hypothetical protein
VRPTPVVEPPFALPSAIPSVVDAAEIAVAELLAEVLGVRRVPVDSHLLEGSRPADCCAPIRLDASSADELTGRPWVATVEVRDAVSTILADARA